MLYIYVNINIYIYIYIYNIYIDLLCIDLFFLFREGKQKLVIPHGNLALLLRPSTAQNINDFNVKLNDYYHAIRSEDQFIRSEDQLSLND